MTFVAETLEEGREGLERALVNEEFLQSHSGVVELLDGEIFYVNNEVEDRVGVESAEAVVASDPSRCCDAALYDGDIDSKLAVGLEGENGGAALTVIDSPMGIVSRKEAGQKDVLKGYSENLLNNLGLAVESMDMNPVSATFVSDVAPEIFPDQLVDWTRDTFDIHTVTESLGLNDSAVRRVGVGSGGVYVDDEIPWKHDAVQRPYDENVGLRGVTSYSLAGFGIGFYDVVDTMAKAQGLTIGRGKARVVSQNGEEEVKDNYESPLFSTLGEGLEEYRSHGLPDAMVPEVFHDTQHKFYPTGEGEYTVKLVIEDGTEDDVRDLLDSTAFLEYEDQESPTLFVVNSRHDADGHMDAVESINRDIAAIYGNMPGVLPHYGE